MTKIKEVKRTERGWAGHFICADSCLFRRNTLLQSATDEIVVSTVGAMKSPWKKGDKFYRGAFEEIGMNRYYETMAFVAVASDTRYHDIDVSKNIYFDSKRSIDHLDSDDEANDMHEAVVAELMGKMAHGEQVYKPEPD